ncbi:kinase-like domain-containing protein [Mycena sanguinolenta]|nr:kinase-like domain-containing protein [Mycena sanguinolenta]
MVRSLVSIALPAVLILRRKYIHQKQTVHHDLKLGNLLDRHRNIIITDFGFANRFEHHTDNLMQTSRGSPCYAAPEFVNSESLERRRHLELQRHPLRDAQRGTSCSTTTPDKTRSLLKMIVPDAQKRASLEDVMRHPWLGVYHAPHVDDEDGVPPAMAFGETVVEPIKLEELEEAAAPALHRAIHRAPCPHRPRRAAMPPIDEEDAGTPSSSCTMQPQIVRLARINYDVLLRAPSPMQEATHYVANSRAFDCTMPGAQNPSNLLYANLFVPGPALGSCVRTTTRRQCMSACSQCALDSTTAVLVVRSMCKNAAVAPTARLTTRWQTMTVALPRAKAGQPAPAQILNAATKRVAQRSHHLCTRNPDSCTLRYKRDGLDSACQGC